MKNMKKKKWLSYMDLADEKYVTEHSMAEAIVLHGGMSVLQPKGDEMIC